MIAKKSVLKLGVVGLMSWCWSASAQTETLSGTQLQGLTYTTAGAPFNGVSPHAEYNPSAPGFANLFTPDGNQSSDLATVLVPNGYNGVTLGNLNSLLAAGAAGQVSFDLLSITGLNGNAPFWVVNIKDPNSGAIIPIYTVNAVPDKPGGVPLLGANPFNQGDSTMASTSPQLGNVFALWSVVANDIVDGTKLGTWQVDSIGVEIGGWNTTAAGEAHIDSITLPGDPAPDAGSTLSLLGVALAGMALAKRKIGK